MLWTILVILVVLWLLGMVTSAKGFQDAIEHGIARAHKTFRHVKSAWIKVQQVRVKEGHIIEYQVNMMVPSLSMKRPPGAPGGVGGWRR